MLAAGAVVGKDEFRTGVRVLEEDPTSTSRSSSSTPASRTRSSAWSCRATSTSGCSSRRWPSTTTCSPSARPAPARPTSRWPWPRPRCWTSRCGGSCSSRPAVEAGERLGFLPGDLVEKINPYLRPLYDALYDILGYDKVAKLHRAAGDRDRAARLHARPHPERRLHHPRRGPEHDPRADEDVPHPHGLPLEDGDHRRHHPDRPPGAGRSSGLVEALEILEGTRRHRVHQLHRPGRGAPPAGAAGGGPLRPVGGAARAATAGDDRTGRDRAPTSGG